MRGVGFMPSAMGLQIEECNMIGRDGVVKKGAVTRHMNK